jgi:cell division septation protein DedD
VLGVAVTGFAALAYYAYDSGTQSMSDSDIFIVNAEPGNIKEAPASPGGAEFAHKEKTIYDAISGEETQKVEKLLPEAETPIISEPAVGHAEKNPEPTTYVNKAEAAKEDTTSELVSDEALGVKLAAPAAVKEVAKAPEPATPASAAEEKPAPEEPKAAEKPKATGSYKIQLGAFASEAEARAHWSKTTKKFGQVVSGSPVIVKFERDDGKIFYRLRASGFDSPASAKAACAKLSAVGQACMYAGK